MKSVMTGKAAAGRPEKKENMAGRRRKWGDTWQCRAGEKKPCVLPLCLFCFE